jgi:hypothetical protein
MEDSFFTWCFSILWINEIHMISDKQTVNFDRKAVD